MQATGGVFAETEQAVASGVSNLSSLASSSAI
jgi:hypothetical protein